MVGFVLDPGSWLCLSGGLTPSASVAQMALLTFTVFTYLQSASTPLHCPLARSLAHSLARPPALSPFSLGRLLLPGASSSHPSTVFRVQIAAEGQGGLSQTAAKASTLPPSSAKTAAGRAPSWDSRKKGRMADEEMKMTGMSVSPPSFPPCHPPLSAHPPALPPSYSSSSLRAKLDGACEQFSSGGERAREGRPVRPSASYPRSRGNVTRGEQRAGGGKDTIRGWTKRTFRQKGKRGLSAPLRPRRPPIRCPLLARLLARSLPQSHMRAVKQTDRQ